MFGELTLECILFGYHLMLLSSSCSRFHPGFSLWFLLQNLYPTHSLYVSSSDSLPFPTNLQKQPATVENIPPPLVSARVGQKKPRNLLSLPQRWPRNGSLEASKGGEKSAS